MLKRLILFCVIIYLILGYSDLCIAVPAVPELSQVTQPNGVVVKVVLTGDEWHNTVETLVGYTIAQGSDRYWHYVSNYKDRLPVLSSTYAHTAPPIDLNKHLRPVEDLNKYRIERKKRAAALDVSPRGEFKGKILFILASFSDIDGTYSESDFSAAISDEIKDYFQKASYGKVTLNPAAETFGQADNGVVGWLNLGYAHPNTGEDTDSRNKELAKKAILKADPYVDFKSFDTNDDGYVDANELAVVVIVAGFERSYSADYTPNVWGHQWNLDDVGAPSVDGVIVGAYHDGAGGYAQFGEIHQALPLLDHRATMGIMVHELGHLIFGLPDLYDRTPKDKHSSSGAGAFCVMSGGNWGKSSSLAFAGQTPVLPSAWVKYKLDWSVGRAVTTGSRAVTAAGATSAGSQNTVFRCSTTKAKEYFLVENRQLLGYDNGLKTWLGSKFGGIAIWHIDESMQDNDDDGHRLVDLEEADGSLMGTGMGQKSDLWYSGNRTIFNNITLPNSRLYGNIQSDVSISDVSASGTVMSVWMLRGQRLKLNAPSNVGNIMPAGDADWYYFNIGAGGTYVISTSAGTLSDTYMYLYGPNSQTTLIQEDDDSGEANTSKITRILEPGTYYVKIRAYSSGTGTYSILLSKPVTAALEAYAIPNPVDAYNGYYPCFSYSPEWQYTVYLRELNGGAVTINQFISDFYDSNGNWLSQYTYDPETFQNWFNDCGAGSAYIAPKTTVCGSLCTHLGGKASGSMIFTFYGVDDLNNSVSTSSRVWFNQPSAATQFEDQDRAEKPEVEPLNSHR